MKKIWDLRGLPYLREQQQLNFQVHPHCGDVIAVGDNLSPGLLLSAYRQGLFPWYNEGEDIYWWSPQRRFVLFPNELHLSRSLLKSMKRSFAKGDNKKNNKENAGENKIGSSLHLSFDRAFAEVIAACATIFRPGQSRADGQPGTWITPEMQSAYIDLHQRGYAHSVECWQRQPDGSENLLGGLYGIILGSCFYGESMFSRVPGASKIAFASLVLFLSSKGFNLIDCQQETEHLRSFGARLIARAEFQNLLQKFLPETLSSVATYSRDFPDNPWQLL